MSVRPPLGHPIKIVNQAKDLIAGGWDAAAASRILKAEHGVYVAPRTILGWANPAQAKRDRDRARVYRDQRSRDLAKFRLSSTTPAYQEAFVVRLREAKVPRTSIAKVCTVVFGEEWSRNRVMKVLGREKASA